MDPFTLICIGLAIAGVAASLSWEAIRSWIASRNKAKYAKLVKRKLSNGNVRIITGVFDSGLNKIEEKSWEAASLDDELKAKFGPRNEVFITV